VSRKPKGQGRKCHYCRSIMAGRGTTGSLAATRDHVVPRSRGAGRGTVWCCRQCNQMKGDMMPDEWYRAMASMPSFGPPLPLPEPPPPPPRRPSTLAKWIAEGRMPNAAIVLARLGLLPDPPGP